MFRELQRLSVLPEAEAARNAASQPYVAEARGKALARGGDGATIQGHASPSEAPRRTAARPAAIPAGRTVPGVPSGPEAKPGVAPRPGAFAPEPASFALPTPVVAPPPPRQSRPQISIDSPPRAQPARGAVDPSPRPQPAREAVPPTPLGHAPTPLKRGTTIPPPIPPRRTGKTVPPATHPAPPAAPPPALETPQREAIAGVIERARTAPPGEFVVAAVSMMPPSARDRDTGPAAAIPQPPSMPTTHGVPEAPTGETPHLIKPRIRGIAESAPGGRTFSVAPGQLGYLAPPKAVSDQQNAARRKWIMLVAGLAVLAIVLGVTIGLLL
jgi:hypothetical protein